MGFQPLFEPQEQVSLACTACEFHIKGCCFDPKKMIKGYFAAPCFGCIDLMDKPQEETVDITDAVEINDADDF
jgi:hypothetical protein